jgi:hypothetical protein
LVEQKLATVKNAGKNFNNKIRAADAKEVGVGNPAEETCCYPNKAMLQAGDGLSRLTVCSAQIRQC